jgi:mycobactin lysine-N-oxygenase
MKMLLILIDCRYGGSHWVHWGGTMTTKTLLIIGAGPKAMAIATKSAVLFELGYSVPEIVIIEKSEVGAHWTGKSGYTNGKLHLTSAPEKDIGFPYDSPDVRLNQRMKDFSWASYLIDKGLYSDWVDRGKPAPEHRQWAWYLQWVWQRLEGRAKILQGEVTHLDVIQNQWRVTYQNGKASEVFCDGIVVTGPGRPKLSGKIPNHDRVFTPETFWKNYERIVEEKSIRIALIGTGENTAAIAVALAQSDNESLKIDILSPNGMPFSRSESFLDSRVFSNPDRGNWLKLTEQDRLNFINTADRGVFSQDAQEVLDRCASLTIVPGRFRQIEPAKGNTVDLITEYNGEMETRNYDYVVVSTGVDQLALLSALMSDATRQLVLNRLGLTEFSDQLIQRKIGASLAVEGLTPRLHLPVLSGLTQGPGFPVLSSLGRLSDRILADYVNR